MAISVADAEVLVALAELVDRRALVRVVHEVDVALQDLRVELERVLDDQPVLGVLLVAQHVHERAVVDAVHAQRADEVALHQPEGLGQQQRVGRFCRDAVDDLAPELDGHRASKSLLRMRVLGAAGDRAARAGLRIPEARDVPLGQRHRRVEADDRELARDVQDGLDDRLAHLGLQVVELRGVVPRHRRAVVAVIDEARVAAPVVDALERHRRVGVVEVVILEVDADARVGRQVRAVERVGRVRRVRRGP